MHHKKLAAAITVAVGLTVLGTAPAQADSRITIKKLGTVSIKYKKKTVTVRPAVNDYYGNLVLDSKKFTIKKGKKTIVRNKTKAKLKPGKYRVTTTITYRKYTETYPMQVRIPAGQNITTVFSELDFPHLGLPCDVTLVRSPNDYDFECTIEGGTPSRIQATNADIVEYWGGGGAPTLPYYYDGELPVKTLRTPVAISAPTLVTTYSKPITVKRTQTLRVKAGKKPAPPAKCTKYSKYLDVEDGMTRNQVYRLLGPSKLSAASGDYETYTYKGCKRLTYAAVTFYDGRVESKAYAG